MSKRANKFNAMLIELLRNLHKIDDAIMPIIIEDLGMEAGVEHLKAREANETIQSIMVRVAWAKGKLKALRSRAYCIANHKGPLVAIT